MIETVTSDGALTEGSIVIDTPESGSAADAEIEASQAATRAQLARARAVELRRLAEELGAEQSRPPPTSAASEAGSALVTEATDGDSVVEADREQVDSGARWGRPSRPTRKGIAMATGILVVCASLTASGYVWHEHRTAVTERHRAAEYAATARVDLTNLMSIDFTTARDGVQHVIDRSTGRFKDEFQSGADDLVAALEQSKVTTTVTVEAVAVQSMTKDSATVLVAATSVASSLGGAQRPPKDFRVLVRLERNNDDVKMSEVEFVR